MAVLERQPDGTATLTMGAHQPDAEVSHVAAWVRQYGLEPTGARWWAVVGGGVRTVFGLRPRTGLALVDLAVAGALTLCVVGAIFLTVQKPGGAASPTPRPTAPVGSVSWDIATAKEGPEADQLAASGWEPFGVIDAPGNGIPAVVWFKRRHP
jgi:hypothetical protein